MTRSRPETPALDEAERAQAELDPWLRLYRGTGRILAEPTGIANAWPDEVAIRIEVRPVVER